MDVTLPILEAFRRDLHRLLSGTSARLLDRLLVAARQRPVFMQPGLRHDHVAAGAFFEHGPRALRRLRLRHHLPRGPISRATIESLLRQEVQDVIGTFELPVLDDPTAGLLGARTSRAHATRAERHRRRA